MEVEKKVRVWRIVRIPLIVAALLIFLTVVTVTMAYLIRGAKIKRTIEENRIKISAGSLEEYTEALNSLVKLFEDYPERSDVISVAAWAYSYGAYQYGPESSYLKKSKKRISAVEEKDGNELYWSAKALNFILDGNAEEAIKVAKEKLQDYKKSDELRFIHALALVSSGQTVEAAIELELLRSRKRPFIPAMLELAKFKYMSGDLKGSSVILKEILEMQPHNTAALIETAHVEIEEGGKSLKRAAKTIGKLEKKLENVPPLLRYRGFLAKGKLLAKKEKYSDAVEPFEEAYKNAPDDPEVVYGLALSYRKSGNPLSAIKILSKLTDIKSVPTNTLVEMVESYYMVLQIKSANAAVKELMLRSDADSGHANYMAALLAANSHSYDISVSYLKAAGDFQDSKVRSAYYQAATGKIRESTKKLYELYSSGNNKCAKILYDWFRKKGETVFERKEEFDHCAHDLQAQLLSKTGRFSQASELFQKEAHLSQFPRGIYYLSMSALRTMGRKIAREEMNKIMKFSPDSFDLLSKMTQAYIEMGLMKEAVQTAQYCRDKNPDNALAYALLAETSRIAQSFEQSEIIVANGLKKFPDEPSILIQKAHILIRNDKPEDAIKLLDEILEKAKRAEDLVKAALLLSTVLSDAENNKDADTVLLDTARKVERKYDPVASMELYAALIASKVKQGGKKNLMKATGFFRNASRKHYPSAKLYYEGGKLLVAGEKLEEAIERFTQAIAIDPSFKAPYEELKALNALNEAQKMNFEKIFEEQP